MARTSAVESLTRWRRIRPGASLVEALLGFGLFVILLVVLLSLMRTGDRLGAQEVEILSLQVEAQKQLAWFIRELQESMTLVVPQPGHTFPYAVVRNKMNQMVYYSLVPGKPPLFTLRRDLAGPAGSESATVLHGIRRLTFTSSSEGAVRLHVVLGEGARDFAFHTEVRLRNRDAAEP